MMPPHPARPHETGSAAIAREIGTEVVRGLYPPGTALPGEIDLATRFGVSRTLVREAIRVLAGKGLVEARRKAGTIIRLPALWQVLDPDVLSWRLASGPEIGFATDLLALREVIEPAAAAFAATQGDRRAIAAIRAAFDQMVAAGGDRQKFAAPDVAFHKAILAATGNEFMNAFGSMIEAALSAFIAISLRHAEAPGPTIPMHEAVLLAIEAGEPTRAREAMLALLSRTRSNIERDATQ